MSQIPSEILAYATVVFEDESRARAWFKEPNRALEGERPLDLLGTAENRERVRRVLDQIEAGVIS